MIWETVQGILTWIGALTVLITVFSVIWIGIIGRRGRNEK